jgi:gas vesicle protein
MRKKSANLFLGFLAGAAAGTIAGILLAPESGKNTRQNLSDKASQLKDNLGNTVQKGVDKLSSFKDSAFSLISKYEEEAKTSDTEVK